MTSPTTYKLGFPKLSYSAVPMASGAPFQRAPTTADLKDTKVGNFYKIGTIWPNAATGDVYFLSSITSGTTANWLPITGSASAVLGPASATDNAIVRFDDTTGKLVQNSAVTVADTTGTMTFAAGGGIVLSATANAAVRKGSFTLVGGTTAKILTTSAVTGSVIVYTVVTLGTVTVASSFLSTIDTGVGFTPVASQATDTSVVNWAIVG